jgi:hypothetical protein
MIGRSLGSIPWLSQTIRRLDDSNYASSTSDGRRSFDFSSVLTIAPVIISQTGLASAAIPNTDRLP